MRDYGVVRVRFWEWAKRKKLSSEAREMALYLLTCPHGNSLGCFRLPLAYLCDDLGATPKTAARTMDGLRRIGFVHVDDKESGWIWITDYLEHNPIPNGNVGKAVGKMFEQVPGMVSFHAELLNRLQGVEFFPKTLLERYRNPFDRVSRDSKTHTQTHEHEHTHEHEQEVKEVRGTNGAIAPLPAAQAVELFNTAAEQAGWPRVQVLNAARKRALGVCLHAVGGIDGWQALLAKATASDFLMGRTPRSDDHASWRFDFDFMLKKHVKIMEGGYGSSGKASEPERGIGAVLAALADGNS